MMKPIHVVAAGSFGDAVAQVLARTLPSVVVTNHDAGAPILPSHWPVSRLLVLAAWRPVPTLTSHLDEAAFAWKVPFVPIVLEHPVLRIGPVVVPGYGACHHCYRKRYLQHTAMASLWDSVYQHYDDNPGDGPRGFLPPISTLAAMTAIEIIDRLGRDPTSEAGQIRQFHMVSQKTMQCGTVGVHGCARCGQHRPERERSYSQLCTDLQPILARAWGHGTREG